MMAAKKKTLEDTGERMIPEHHKGRNIYGTHLGRYMAGCDLVKNKVILDIACGSGYGSKLMSATAKKVYAVDVDKDTIRYAKDNYAAKNIEYIVGDGAKIPLDDNSVDLVVSYETIEHIEAYKEFLREVKRVLKPKGLLMLSTPNDKEYSKGNHFHYFEFTHKQLQAAVGEFFSHTKDYFQVQWLSSTIVDSARLETEWTEKIDTTSTISLKPDDCIYFFVLCADREITEEIDVQAVIGEHHRPKQHIEQGRRYQEIRGRMNDAIAAAKELKVRNEELKLELSARNKKIRDMSNVSLIDRVIRKIKRR